MRALRRIKFISISISFALITVMLWVYGGVRVHAENYVTYSKRPVSLAAPPSRFDELLSEIKDVVEQSSSKTKSAPEKGFDNIGKLTALKESLEEEHEKNQDYFDSLRSSIERKKLPDEVLNRHRAFVEQYESRYEALLKNLESIESAHSDATGLWARLTGTSKKADWDGIIGKTLGFLEEHTPRPAQSRFDPKNLPHRSLKADKPTPPKLTRGEWARAFPGKSAGTGSVPVKKSGPNTLAATAQTTPADLEETIEVKFTPEIRQLADSLDKNPVKIFNWVRNNIEFVPTWGSIQGAQLCMENRAGNAFDTASLLIALLRYSGIQARYQMGTIEVPVEKFKNWAGGFTDADAAASLFAGAGVPSVVRRVNQTGQVSAVRLEHVWVKALVDYAPSGGAVHRQGADWVEMDPSFKLHTLFQGVDLDAAVPSDFQAFVNQLASSATIDPATGSVTNFDRQALESFLILQADRRLNYVQANIPNATDLEIVGGHVIAAQSLAVLAATRPYRVLARANELSQIPDSLRHSVTIALGADIQTPDSADQWSYTTSLPEIAGKEVSLLYGVASQADEQLLDSIISASGGNLPIAIPSSINLVAQLYIGNELKATGQPLSVGRPVISQIKFSSPTISIPPILNTMIVGDHAAICFDLQDISPAQMDSIKHGMRQLGEKIQQEAYQTITKHDITNLLLTSGVTGWFIFMDAANRFASASVGVVTVRYPSVGMMFARNKVRSLFGATASISIEGFNMDIDGDVVVSVAKDGVASKTMQLSRVMGSFGSSQEARIPERIMAVSTHPLRAASTMDALALANDQGIPIFQIDASNASTIVPMLQVDSGDLTEIQDAINAGLRVTVSKTPVNFNGQNILGMIIEDSRTGSAAYLISGGTNGMLVDDLNDAVAMFALMDPNKYERLFDSGYDFLPTLNNKIVDLGIEAYEAFENTRVPRGYTKSCYRVAFITEYLGQRLPSNPNDPNFCGICQLAAEIGAGTFAAGIRCRDSVQ